MEERTQALAAKFRATRNPKSNYAVTERLLRELSARSLRLQDEERRRFARDLHDSTGQTLVALKMCLASLAGLMADSPKAAGLLNDLEALADEALREIRTISHLLHPPMLDEVGFSSRRAVVCGRVRMKRSGIKTTLRDLATPRLTKDGELGFFPHSAREPHQRCASLEQPRRGYTLEFRSRRTPLPSRSEIMSKGISPKTLASFGETGAGGGVGLGGMKQRVRNLGGHLQVESGGDGTCVTATLPLKDAASAEAEDGSTGQPSTAA